MLYRPLDSGTACQHHINNLAGFEGLPGWGSACESQDDGTKYLYSIVVCSMHVHCYGDQVIFM